MLGQHIKLETWTKHDGDGNKRHFKSGLCGVVVKTPDWEPAGPGFESRV